MAPPRRLAVLISGSGTNLQALIDACASGALPHTTICLVLSNRKAAHGLVRAQEAAIPTGYLALQPYLKARGDGATRGDYDAEVARRVLAAAPDAVVLAGWMHVFGERFLGVMGAGGVPVVNLHPALPGAFDGAGALQRAYDAWGRGEVRGTGVMVHRVVAEVDRGAPVVVRAVEFREGEGREAFEARVHAVEWEVIVEGAGRVLDEVRPVEGEASS